MLAKQMRKCTAALLGVIMTMSSLPLIAHAEEETEKESILLAESVVTFADSGVQPAQILSNVDSGFLFYDQLDANNKLSYEVTAEYLQAPHDEAMIIALPEEIILYRNSQNINNWSEEEFNEYANAVILAAMPGVVSCTLDYPELFWLDFQTVACSLPTNGVTYKRQFFSDYRYEMHITQIALEPNHSGSYADLNEILEVRDRILEEVDAFPAEGDTDYDKCKNIYRRILDIVTYDVSGPYAHSIAGVLYDTNAVCEGYAKTFKMICDREGIPCLCILGNFDEAALTAHMWNYVWLDGAWYACDPTWDDALGNLTYFMRGSDMFAQKHTPESPYSIMEMSFPELSPTDYIPAVEETTTTSITTTMTILTTTETTSTYASGTTTSTEVIATSTETTTETETTITEEMTSTTTDTTTTTTETTTITTTIELPMPQQPTGDVNNDGTLTMLDVVLLRKYLVHAAELTEDNMRLADMNTDGRINIFDALLLLQELYEMK